MFFPDKLHQSEEPPTIDQSDITAKAPVVELEVTNGRKIQAKLITVSIRQIRLSPDNPRIKHKVEGRGEDEIEDLLWQEEGTRNLYNEIKYSGGLSDKPIVNSRLVAIEGNRRIACLRRLDDQVKNGELSDYDESAFETAQCLMLPPNVEPKDVELLLARVHVSGKKEWSPLSQAEQIFEMVNKHGMSVQEVAKALSLNPHSVEVMFEAYRATLEYGRLYPDEGLKWVHKFSYFYELFRSRRLSQWAKEETNQRLFMSLIVGKEPKITLGRQVRDLHSIIEDKQAFDVLLADGFDKAISCLSQKQQTMGSFAEKLIEASKVLQQMVENSAIARLDQKELAAVGDIRKKAELVLNESGTNIQRR